MRAPLSADVQLLAHLRTDDALPVLDLMIREYRNVPTALSVDDLRRVRRHLAYRDALIADCAVSTGARRMEALGLAVNDLPDSHLLGKTPIVGIAIIGEGERRRTLQARLPRPEPIRREYFVFSRPSAEKSPLKSSVTTPRLS